MTSQGVAENIHRNCWIRFFLACGGAIMMNGYNGVIEAHSAVLLPRLRDSDSPVQVTDGEETWIASLGIFATPISAIFCGPFIDYFGRKVIIQGYYLMCALGFGIIAIATSVTHLYVGRILCSFGVGLQVSGVVYVAEVSTKHQRSLCMALSYAMYTGGILVTYIVSAVLPWNLGSASYALLSFIIVLYQCLTPESPQWLFKKGRIDCAVTAFKRLGRSDAHISEEMKILQERSLEKMDQKLDWRMFLQPTVWKPFLIISLFQFLHASTGVYDVLYYAVDFIDKLGTEYDPFQVSTGMAIGRFLVTCTIGSYFITKLKRKTATAISGFSTGVTLLVAAAYEHQNYGVPASHRPNTWIPILAVLASVLTSCVGVLHLPWIMNGEVFPLQVRGTMGGAVFFIGSASMFLFIKLYIFFIETFALAGTLLLFAVASLVTGLFGIFILTETQNKSLHEIERSYEKKTKPDDVDITKAGP